MIEEVILVNQDDETTGQIEKTEAHKLGVLHSAAERRLAEEMGLQCSLHYIFKFRYFARVSETLSEHEIDHMFFGVCDDAPAPQCK